MAARRSEAGLGLLELLVCVGLLAAGCVGALALLPAIARASQAQLMRGAATEIARNAIERVRAATAYAPPAAGGDAATLATHAWALRASDAYETSVRVRRTLCGGAGAVTDVPVSVATAYDAGSDTVRVTVTYPPNPCVPAAHAAVVLTHVLGPPALAPQTRVTSTLADPAQQ